MTTSNVTASAVAQASPSVPALAALRGRLLDITAHLQCADGILYDLQNVPEELHPACIVVHRATAELDRLHDELDRRIGLDARARAADSPSDPVPAGPGARVARERLMPTIVQAVVVLRAAAAAFGNGAEPEACLGWGGVGELVDIATGCVESVLDEDDTPAAFDALDLLTVAKTALRAGEIPRNGRTISPIACLLRTAAARLEELYGVQDDTPADRAQFRAEALAVVEGA